MIEENIVITDCRFPNEIELIQRLDGIIVRIKRGEDPPWWDTAVEDNENRNTTTHNPMMPRVYPEVHASEYSWPGCIEDNVIVNDGTLQDLEETVKNLNV